MQLFGKKSATQVEKRPDGRDRLPAGQYLTKKWPVLSYEATPKQLPPNWKLKITGLVENPFELTWEEFLALPHTVLTADFHCVTTWSRYDNTWEGIHIREILQRAKAFVPGAVCHGPLLDRLHHQHALRRPQRR